MITPSVLQAAGQLIELPSTITTLLESLRTVEANLAKISAERAALGPKVLAQDAIRAGTDPTNAVDAEDAWRDEADELSRVSKAAHRAKQAIMFEALPRAVRATADELLASIRAKVAELLDAARPAGPILAEFVVTESIVARGQRVTSTRLDTAHLARHADEKQLAAYKAASALATDYGTLRRFAFDVARVAKRPSAAMPADLLLAVIDEAQPAPVAPAEPPPAPRGAQRQRSAVTS